MGHLPLEDEQQMKEKVATVVRALDNVIDLNFYPIPFAQITNHHYRSIGLGVSGYHHALAIRGIRWESEEHLSFMDKIFERINYAAIEASAELAKEKGRYDYFEEATGKPELTLQNAIMTHPHGKHWPQRLQHPE